MKSIIRRWYEALNFPESWSCEFDVLLENSSLEPTNIFDYQLGVDAQQDFLMYLYFAENLYLKYAIRGIPESILMQTLSDLVIWAKVYYELNGKIGLSEPKWLSRHLSMKLFRLGRLQFCMADGEVEIHIPGGEPLLPEECQCSINRSKEFFKTYYPEYNFDKYTCHSWLLDDTLRDFVGENANITKFRNLFTVYHRDQSDAALKYIFRWDTRRENLSAFPANSSFAVKIKEFVLNGGVLFEATGAFSAKKDL